MVIILKQYKQGRAFGGYGIAFSRNINDINGPSDGCLASASWGRAFSGSGSEQHALRLSEPA
jgi:hypothetical protein